MIFTFTGPRALTERQASYVRQSVRGLLKPGDIAVVGVCVGTDALIAHTAYAIPGVHVHAVVPANRSQIDPDWRKYCDTSEEMPPSEDPYRDRNKRMVDIGNSLVGYPARPEKESPRSGTWMTIRLARKAGKPTEVHILSEEV